MSPVLVSHMPMPSRAGVAAMLRSESQHDSEAGEHITAHVALGSYRKYDFTILFCNYLRTLMLWRFLRRL